MSEDFPPPDTDQNGIRATTARRLQLIGTGYAPIPLYGKEPPIYKKNGKYGNNEHGGLTGWQAMHAVTPEQVRMWEKTWPDAYGTGLLSRRVPAGDIDILNLEAANAVEALAREHFEERGHMLFRFGMAPKRAFLLRTDEPFTKITSIVFAPDGSKQRIEILGDGEQLAAFGTHPGTGKPYSWFGGEPGQIAREDLPYVREADARAFVDEATRLLITEYGYSLADPKQEQRQKGNGHDQGEAWSFAAEARMREALAHIPANEAALTAKLGDSHSAFVNIGRAIERLDWGERGFNILRDWCSQSPKFDPAGLQTQWNSFARTRGHANPVTIGTVFHYAKQFGWSEQRDGKPTQQEEPSAEEREIFSAADLQKMDFAPVKTVVPGIFVEGLTLLCGKPKAGKSWLLLHAAHAIASSGFTLGHLHCLQGDVLYCSLEDPKRRLQSRMRKLFGDQSHSARLHFKIKMPRLMQGGLAMLRDWIKSVPEPRLIAIDTLAMVRMPNRKDQSVYDADYAAVVELRNMAQEFGIAIVVVHHVRKLEADDPFDTVSGTLGLTGCPDAIIILKRDTAGTMLLGKGRDLEDFEKAITFNKDNGTWRIDGDADDVRRSAQQQTIIEALQEAEGPQKPMQIAGLTGMKRENVRFLLRKMVASGALKSARGKYEIAPKIAKAADDDPEF